MTEVERDCLYIERRIELEETVLENRRSETIAIFTIYEAKNTSQSTPLVVSLPKRETNITNLFGLFWCQSSDCPVINTQYQFARTPCIIRVVRIVVQPNMLVSLVSYR
jgi:hypothetical protein